MNPNTIAGFALLAATVLLACAWLYNRKRGSVMFANIAEGTHEHSITRKTDAAIATRHLLYKKGSDNDHIAVAGVADLPQGVVADEAGAAEEYVSVNILGKGPTKRMIASEALVVGDEIFTAANGKVQNRPAGAGTYWYVGTALSAAAGDGDIVEVADTQPVKLVI